MPDIVSRIKVEAQGADQAAREIRKLKEAYDQVAASAKGLSPGAIGGGDPFSKAVSPNSGVMAGGQSNADVAARETRNRDYQEQSRQRQSSNSGYNNAIRPGAVGGAFSTAEAAGAGRGGAAAGGLANMAGGLVGGPIGIALMALGAGAMGVQKFAESSYGRMENVFGGGISQRLGASYENTQNYMTELGRTGVPIGMVNALMTSASTSGAQFTKGTAGQFGLFADVMTGAGVDAGLLGQLLGTTQRAGVNMEYGTLAGGAGTFGRGSLGTFLTEMNRTIEGAMTSGIKLSQDEVNQRGNVLAGYAQFGGLSPTGAVALNQLATNRAQSAAQLQTPEDIIAFQAMRKSGESVTDTMMRMEQNPTETNEAVFQYLQRSTGGDEDLMRMRVQKYMGAGTSMSMVDAFIQSSGREYSTAAGKGVATAGVRGKIYDDDGNLVDYDQAREVTAARQIEALKGVQDAALELTTMLGGVAAWITGNPINTNATNVQFGGVRRDLMEAAQGQINQTIEEVNTITAQDVSNLTAEIDEANLTIKDMNAVDPWLQNPNFATNASTIRSLRENEGLQGQINEISDATPGWMGAWRSLKEGDFQSFGGGVGGFSSLFNDILSAVRGQAKKEAVEGLGLFDIGGKIREKGEITDVIDPILMQFYNRQTTTEGELSTAIRELVTALSEAGIVFTDGEMVIPTVGN